MPRSPLVGTFVVGYARSICIHCPGDFLVIERLFPPSSGGIREASPVELGEPSGATKPSKTDQGAFGKTASACRSASKTDQAEFSEAHSGSQASRINPGEIGASAAAKEARTRSLSHKR
jgi:hypothetical protein